MANYKTGAQRYNDRMDKIFAKSEELGHHSLHGSKELKEKKAKMAGKMTLKKRGLKPYKQSASDKDWLEKHTY